MALLDEAIGLESDVMPLSGKVVLVKDCVTTSGAFILNHLIKKMLTGSSDAALGPKESSERLLSACGLVLFIGLSEPYTHYERIARKLGCNLSAYREKGQFIFMDLLHLESKGGKGGKTDNTLSELYKSVHQTLHNSISSTGRMGCSCVIIDDVSLLEIAVHGSEDLVLDFLHYCRMLTSELGCSFVLLSHQDIYTSEKDSSFIEHVEYFADIVIHVEPLNSGIATDVHGQLTVIRRVSDSNGINTEVRRVPENMVNNFHFRVKENMVQYFPPGKQI